MSEVKKMNRVPSEKLNPCKACGFVPVMVRVRLELGEWGIDKSSSKIWCYEVSCCGYHHMITFRHQDRAACARLWRSFNNREKQDT